MQARGCLSAKDRAPASENCWLAWRSRFENQLIVANYIEFLNFIEKITKLVLSLNIVSTGDHPAQIRTQKAKRFQNGSRQLPWWSGHKESPDSVREEAVMSKLLNLSNKLVWNSKFGKSTI